MLAVASLRRFERIESQCTHDPRRTVERSGNRIMLIINVSDWHTIQCLGFGHFPFRNVLITCPSIGEAIANCVRWLRLVSWTMDMDQM